MGMQKVWWCSNNLTQDRLEVRFEKVVTTNCGKELRSPADTQMKPGESVCGSTFSGELTYETQIWNEHCNLSTNRVKAVRYENLKIRNISKEERDQAEIEAKQQQAKEDAEKNAAAKATEKSASGGQSGTGSATSSAKTADTEAVKQQAYQQEQARIAKQQAEAAAARQAAWKQEQERYQRELDKITEKSNQRAETGAAVLEGIGSVYNLIKLNQARKSIAELNSKRRNGVRKLEEKINSGDYEMADCDRCRGEGSKSCSPCRSTGQIPCRLCQGRAGQPCVVCNGTGINNMGPYKLACTSCSGKGEKICTMCNNVGKDICSLCNGTGDDFCVSCDGTGKKAVRLQIKETYVPATSGRNDLNGNESDPGEDKAPVVDPAKAELSRMKAQDKAILEKMNAPLLENSFEATTDSLYVISYEHVYTPEKKGIAEIRSYVVYRQPDGYFPFRSDLPIKVQENFDDEEERTQFFFFIARPTDLEAAILAMEAAAKKEGMRIKKNGKPIRLSTYTRKKLTGDEFWNYYERWYWFEN